MTESPFDPPGAGGQTREPTEEELHAAYEAEMKRLRIEDVIVQTAVSLMNLGARRAGLVPGSEDERDLAQVQLAIEGARALLPLVEPQLGPNAGPLRDALSQLQIAYTQLSAEGGASPPPPAEAAQAAGEAASQPAEEGESAPGPAEQSGRLWVPGQ